MYNMQWKGCAKMFQHLGQGGGSTFTLFVQTEQTASSRKRCNSVMFILYCWRFAQVSRNSLSRPRIELLRGQLSVVPTSRKRSVIHTGTLSSRERWDKRTSEHALCSSWDEEISTRRCLNSSNSSHNITEGALIMHLDQKFERMLTCIIRAHVTPALPVMQSVMRSC